MLLQLGLRNIANAFGPIIESAHKLLFMTILLNFVAACVLCHMYLA